VQIKINIIYIMKRERETNYYNIYDLEDNLIQDIPVTKLVVHNNYAFNVDQLLLSQINKNNENPYTREQLWNTEQDFDKLFNCLCMQKSLKLSLQIREFDYPNKDVILYLHENQKILNLIGSIGYFICNTINESPNYSHYGAIIYLLMNLKKHTILKKLIYYPTGHILYNIIANNNLDNIGSILIEIYLSYWYLIDTTINNIELLPYFVKLLSSRTFAYVYEQSSLATFMFASDFPIRSITTIYKNKTHMTNFPFDFDEHDVVLNEIIKESLYDNSLLIFDKYYKYFLNRDLTNMNKKCTEYAKQSKNMKKYSLDLSRNMQNHHTNIIQYLLTTI